METSAVSFCLPLDCCQYHRLCAKPCLWMSITSDCGDPSDLVAVGATPAPETDCNMACAGGPAELCGGSARFNLYQWSGNLNNWATPSNPGYYQFLIGGPVVPLLTTVTITNKVVMLEKIASANLNSTHAYEFDYSLSDAGKAFREMHVSSDVFCSAGAILPDIAGRVINLGGWSLNALLGVRLYTPTGRPGVNGTTDWEENDSVLALQVCFDYNCSFPLSLSCCCNCGSN